MNKIEWLKNEIKMYSEMVQILEMRPEHDGANHRKDYKKYIEKCKQEIIEAENRERDEVSFTI